MDFKEFKEHGARSGYGTILAHRLPNESKYHITCALTDIPSIFGSRNTIEWSSTSNSAVTQIPAKKTTNSVEVNFLWNADNIAIMDSISDREINFAIINLDDGTGWKFTANSSYRMGDISPSNPRQGVLQLTINSVEDKASLDMLSVYMDTITFNNAMDLRIDLSSTDETNKKYEYIMSTDPSDALITVESDSQSIATVSYTSNKVTITAVAKGTTYIHIKATKADYASNSRAIYVKVD